MLHWICASLLDILHNRPFPYSNRVAIRYKIIFCQDLIDAVKSEMSGKLCDAIVESLFDPDYYDAYSLHKAMKGAGTRENVLTEILTSRSNQQIEKIKVLYKQSELFRFISDFHISVTFAGRVILIYILIYNVKGYCQQRPLRCEALDRWNR